MEYIRRLRNSKNRPHKKSKPNKAKETTERKVEGENFEADKERTAAGTSNFAVQEAEESEKGSTKRQREETETSSVAFDQEDVSGSSSSASDDRNCFENLANLLAYQIGALEDEVNAILQEIKSGEIGKEALIERIQSLQDEIKSLIQENYNLKEMGDKELEYQDLISEHEATFEEFEKMYLAEISKRDKLQADLVQEIEDLKEERRNEKKYVNQYVVSQCQALLDDYKKMFQEKIEEGKRLREAQENEIMSLRKEIDCLVQMKKSQNVGISQLHEAVGRYKEEIVHFQELLSGVVAENKLLKEENNAILEKEKEYQDTIARYVELFDDSQNELFGTIKSQEELHKEVEEGLVKDIKVLKEEKSALLDKEKKHLRMISGYKERLNVLENKLREGKGKEETERLKAKVSELEDCNRQLSAQTEHRLKVMESLRFIILKNEKNNLELRSLKAENARLTAVEQQNLRLKEELAKWQADNAETFKQLLLENKELLFKNQEMNSEIHILRKEGVEGLKDKARITQLEEEYDTLQKEYERLSAENGKNKRVCENLIAVVLENARLQQEMAAFKEEHDETFRELILQNEEKDKEIQSLVEALQEAPLSPSFLPEGEVEFSFVKENDKLREELDVLTNKIYELSNGMSEIHRLSRENEDLEMKNAGLVESIGKVATKYQETADNIAETYENVLGHKTEDADWLSNLKEEKIAFHRITEELKEIAERKVGDGSWDVKKMAEEIMYI